MVLDGSLSELSHRRCRVFQDYDGVSKPHAAKPCGEMQRPHSHSPALRALISEAPHSSALKRASNMADK